MPRFETDPDARRLGQALALLRRERGLSQAEAGARAGMTSQGWGFYEAGRRPGLFRPDVQRRLTVALDATPEGLGQILARVSDAVPNPEAEGLESGGRRFDGGQRGLDTTTRTLQLSNDDLRPWAVSAVVLEYQPGRWPRRDQGCIIEMKDGTRLARLYDRADTEVIVVRGGPQGLDAEERLLRSGVISVAAVIARREPG